MCRCFVLRRTTRKSAGYKDGKLLPCCLEAAGDLGEDRDLFAVEFATYF